jgi:nudix-type nucleoside diphosphatase (YffH/AdpP family)
MGELPWFLWGALAEPGLAEAATGARLDRHPARLPAAHLVAGPVLPALAEGGAGVAGDLVRPGPAAAAALDRLARALGLTPCPAQVLTAEGQGVAALVPRAAVAPPSAPPFDPAAWAARGRPLLQAALPDLMAELGCHPPEAVAARLPMILVRAASRLRAAAPAPATLRGAGRGVEVLSRRTPYARFFATEDWTLRHARFDGTMGPVVDRAVFVSGDAVTVLPYDPARDRVLIVEQFRVSPFARGDANPWSLEAIAGRIDPGETPEEAARREAAEEAGLALGRLVPVASYYPSPGCFTEYLYSYVGICDLPDGAAGVFGVESEAEDIRGHLLPFARLMELVATGEVANAPLILTALWLAGARAGLGG